MNVGLKKRIKLIIVVIHCGSHSFHQANEINEPFNQERLFGQVASSHEMTRECPQKMPQRKNTALGMAWDTHSSWWAFVWAHLKTLMWRGRARTQCNQHNVRQGKHAVAFPTHTSFMKFAIYCDYCFETGFHYVPKLAYHTLRSPECPQCTAVLFQPPECPAGIIGTSHHTGPFFSFLKISMDILKA